MKPAKWRELSDDEVKQKVRELSEEIFNLRFQLSMGVAKNPSRVREARRDLARAYTILREKGIPAGAVAVTAPPAAPPRKTRAAKSGERRAPAPKRAATAGKRKG